MQTLFLEHCSAYPEISAADWLGKQPIRTQGKITPVRKTEGSLGKTCWEHTMGRIVCGV